MKFSIDDAVKSQQQAAEKILSSPSNVPGAERVAQQSTSAQIPQGIKHLVNQEQSQGRKRR